MSLLATRKMRPRRLPLIFANYPNWRPADDWYLKELFEGKDIEEHGKLWNHAWKAKSTNWDRGGPSMALYETLLEYPELFNGKHPGPEHLRGFVGHGFGHDAVSGPTQPSKTKTKTALVPACGRGYDAVLLALVFGYQVCALDISEQAMLEAKAYMTDLQNAFKGKSEGPHDFAFWVSNLIDEIGGIKYIVGDFFSDQWMKEARIEGMKFDLIFDYTFFCAIPPTARPKWAARMHQLLARPNGRLVCLEFPTGRHLEDGGPPYSAAFWYYQLHLTHPGNEEIIKYEVTKDFKHPRTGEDLRYTQKQYNSINKDARNPNDDGLMMLARFKPKETHKEGQDEDGKFGRDWISVWGPPLGQPRGFFASGHPQGSSVKQEEETKEGETN